MDKRVEIVEGPIVVDECISAVARPDAGGLNVFLGTVRNTTKGRKVVRLEYEAYEPMAVAEIDKIVVEAAKRWQILSVCTLHGVGTLLPGEVAVAIGVSTAHRGEAFEACRYIIDEMKKSVPIWKKEVFEDGENWVSAHP